MDDVAEIPHYTVGGPEEAECPHCGKDMNLSDWVTDDNLKIGTTGDCQKCNGAFEIMDVNSSITLWLKKAGI